MVGLEPWQEKTGFAGCSLLGVYPRVFLERVRKSQEIGELARPLSAKRGEVQAVTDFRTDGAKLPCGSREAGVEVSRAMVTCNVYHVNNITSGVLVSNGADSILETGRRSVRGTRGAGVY